jgi:hypothetical protein
MLQPTDWPPTSLAGPVGGFHEPWSAAGHDREASTRELCTDTSGERVIRETFSGAGRAENSHARAKEVERAKAAHHLAEDPHGLAQLKAAVLRPLQEPHLVRSGPASLPSCW